MHFFSSRGDPEKWRNIKLIMGNLISGEFGSVFSSTSQKCTSSEGRVSIKHIILLRDKNESVTLAEAGAEPRRARMGAAASIASRRNR